MGYRGVEKRRRGKRAESHGTTQIFLAQNVLLSESGYTTDQLAMEWLDHFIFHTQSTPTFDHKVLLFDSHTSHRKPEFTILAAENNIITYAFPSHLTHVLQPLDIEFSNLTSIGIEKLCILQYAP